jgi:hypothetical protein
VGLILLRVDPPLAHHAALSGPTGGSGSPHTSASSNYKRPRPRDSDIGEAYPTGFCCWYCSSTMRFHSPPTHLFIAWLLLAFIRMCSRVSSTIWHACYNTAFCRPVAVITHKKRQ